MVLDPAREGYIIEQPQGSSRVLLLWAAAPLLGQQEHWGHFSSQPEAIAQRVRLIRAGQCQPA